MIYKGSKQPETYYNEFVDYDNLKARSKPKNQNRDTIKITTKKLPPDFFRPLTRQNLDVETYPVQKLSGLKTPCFGEQKPQSYSLSLIPKNKHNFEELVTRMETLPTEKSTKIYQSHPKRNHSRQLYKNQQQYSYRMKERDPSEISHQTTQRRRLQYQKKLTLNDQIDMNKSKSRNICENRIRLNIKKFFKQDNFDSRAEKNQAKRKWKNGSNKLPPLL